MLFKAFVELEIVPSLRPVGTLQNGPPCPKHNIETKKNTFLSLTHKNKDSIFYFFNLFESSLWPQ
jgi:hypothetical protein